MTSDKPKNAFGIRADKSGEPGNATAGQLHVGDVIEGRYQVVGIIGRGAMGAVYAVDQLFLQKRFALKTLNPLNQIEIDDVLVMRFQKEAKTTSRLDHPNLVRSIDFGMIDNQQPFLVMDYVEGHSLAQFLQQRGKLPVKMALEIFIPICFGIAYAHQEGIVHRDLKPGNILLAKPEENSTLQFIPKVVDFGISKIVEAGDAQNLTKTGEVFGTPLYMSPEQCIGTAVDQRSDIYSLGCVMYEALTGTVPFVAATALQTMMGHRESPIPPMKEASLGTEFPPPIEQIIRKMLAKDPKDRYQDCTALAEDLISFQQTGSIQSAHKVTVQRPAKPGFSKPIIAHKPARMPPLTIIGFAILIGVVGYLAISQIKSYFANKQAQNPSRDTIVSVSRQSLKPGVNNDARDPYAKPGSKNTDTQAPHTNKKPELQTEKTKNPGDKNQAAPDPDRKDQWSPSLGRFRDLLDQSQVVFNFPPHQSLGDIYSWLPGKEVKIKPALGQVTFPNDSQRILDIGGDLLDNPAYAVAFKDGDLTGVRFGHSAVLDPEDAANSLENMLRIESLRMLSLKWFPISEEVLFRITHMPNLRWLNCDKSLTPKQLISLPQLRQLSVLECINLVGGSTVIRKLAGSSQLQRLSLRGSKIKATDVAAIAKCRNLVRLDLRNSFAYGEIFSSHGNNRRKLLEELSLLPNLQFFAPGYLIDPKPLPQDLEPLKKMRQLKVLYVDDFLPMTKEAVELVKQAVSPDCKVVLSSEISHSKDKSDLLPPNDTNEADRWTDFRYTNPGSDNLLGKQTNR